MDLKINKNYVLTLTEEEFNTIVMSIGYCTFQNIKTGAMRYKLDIVNENAQEKLYSLLKNEAGISEY